MKIKNIGAKVVVVAGALGMVAVMVSLPNLPRDSYSVSVLFTLLAIGFIVCAMATAIAAAHLRFQKD